MQTLYFQLPWLSIHDISLSNICDPTYPPLQKNVFQWRKPSYGWIKLNTDASLTYTDACIGGIFRDIQGDALSDFSLLVEQESVYIMELKAIQKGLEKGIAKNYKKLWVETDSELAVRYIENERICPDEGKTVVRSIRDLLAQLEAWKVSHVYREANGAADYLSKPYRVKGDDITVEDFPIELHKIVEENKSGKEYCRFSRGSLLNHTHLSYKKPDFDFDKLTIG